MLFMQMRSYPLSSAGITEKNKEFLASKRLHLYVILNI